MKANQTRVDDRGAIYVHVRARDTLATALEAAGLRSPRPVLVVVGGAGKLDAPELRRLTPLFRAGLAPAIEKAGAVAVDGGTDAGVMRLLGDAREANSATFPLVGVAAEGTVRLPGTPGFEDDAADLEPHHTHFVLVPGDQWGDEASWITATASDLAGSAPSLTVLVNGGDIAYRDATLSVEAGRPLLVIRGSGRAADEIAAAIRGEPSDPRAHQIVTSGLVTYVDIDDPAGVGAAVSAALEPPTR
jgi:hypothetical protein